MFYIVKRSVISYVNRRYSYGYLEKNVKTIQSVHRALYPGILQFSVGMVKSFQQLPNIVISIKQLLFI